MSIDLYGGSIELYFKTKNGVARSMRSIVFDENTNTQDDSYCNFVENCTVKISIARMTEISVTLVPPFPQAVKLIQSGVIGLGFSTKTATGESSDSNQDTATPTDTSFNFNTLIVRLIYGGKDSSGKVMKSPYFKGILLPPDFDISTEGITITLKAIGMLFQQTKTSLKKSYQNQTRLSILKEAISDQKNVNLISSPQDAKCNKAMEEIDNLNAAESNQSVISKILEKSNCVLVDKGADNPDGIPTYELVSMDHLRSKKDTAAIFVIWNDIDPNNGIYPITGMKTSLNNVLLGQSLGINTVSLNQDTKKFTDSSKENTSTSKNQFTTKVSSSDGSASGGNSDSTIQNQLVSKHGPLDLKDTLLGVLQKSTDQAMQYEIETIGLPQLLPGRSVTIKVANIKFLSGAYDLYAVEHNWSTEGISTHLNLSRTAGLANLISLGVEKTPALVTPGSPNTKTAIPQSSPHTPTVPI
jgi:hypothetical protein